MLQKNVVCVRFLLLVLLSFCNLQVCLSQAVQPLKDLRVGNKWIYFESMIKTGFQGGIYSARESYNNSFYRCLVDTVLKDTNLNGVKFALVMNSDQEMSWQRVNGDTLFSRNGNYSTIGTVEKIIFVRQNGLYSSSITSRTSGQEGNRTFSTRDSLIYLAGKGIVEYSSEFTEQFWMLAPGMPHFFPMGRPSIVIAENNIFTRRVLQATVFNSQVDGDTNTIIPSIKLEMVTTLTLKPDSIYTIPIKLSSNVPLGRVLSTHSTIQLNYYGSALEFIEPQEVVMIDSSSRGIIKKLQLKISGDSIIPIRIRWSKTTSNVENLGQLRFASKFMDTKISLYQLEASDCTVNFFRPSFRVQSSLDSSRLKTNDSASINIDLLGIKQLTDYGIRKIRLNLHVHQSLKPKNLISQNGTDYQIPIDLLDSVDKLLIVIPIEIQFFQLDINSLSVEYTLQATAVPYIADILLANASGELKVTLPSVRAVFTTKRIITRTNDTARIPVQVIVTSAYQNQRNNISYMAYVSNLDIAKPIPSSGVQGVTITSSGIFRQNLSFSTDTFDFTIPLKIEYPRDTIFSLNFIYTYIATYPPTAVAFSSVTSTIVEVRNPRIRVVSSGKNLVTRFGDSLTVPFEVLSSVPLSNYGIRTLDMEFTMNSSILEPLNSENKGLVINGIRQIPISIPIQENETSHTVRLMFRPVVGNTTSTFIIPKLNMNQHRGVNFVTSTQSAYVEILTNLAGNVPLLFFSASQKVILNKVYPNPSSGLVTIECNITESGNITINLYDSNGNFVRKVHDVGFQMIGQYVKSLYVGDLPSGSYRLVIHHNNVIASSMMFSVIR